MALPKACNILAPHERTSLEMQLKINTMKMDVNEIIIRGSPYKEERLKALDENRKLQEQSFKIIHLF